MSSIEPRTLASARNSESSRSLERRQFLAHLIERRFVCFLDRRDTAACTNELIE